MNKHLTHHRTRRHDRLCFGAEQLFAKGLWLKIQLELNNLNSILSRSAVTPVFPVCVWVRVLCERAFTCTNISLFTHATWLIDTWAMTHVYMGHEAFLTHSQATPRSPPPPYACVWQTHISNLCIGGCMCACTCAVALFAVWKSAHLCIGGCMCACTCAVWKSAHPPLSHSKERPPTQPHPPPLRK